jgi:hypothetical protein
LIAGRVRKIEPMIPTVVNVHKMIAVAGEFQFDGFINPKVLSMLEIAKISMAAPRLQGRSCHNLKAVVPTKIAPAGMNINCSQVNVPLLTPMKAITIATIAQSARQIAQTRRPLKAHLG